MPRRARASAAFGALVLGGSALLNAGCVGVPTGLGAGEPCVRSAQCQPSLVCSMGMCTADLTGLGMPPVRPMDGGPVDAQVDPDAEVDGGIDMDAGPEVDSGPEIDAFVPEVDSGPEIDAFVPEVDAFVPEVDAFVPEVDAFVPDEDAGP